MFHIYAIAILIRLVNDMKSISIWNVTRIIMFIYKIKGLPLSASEEAALNSNYHPFLYFRLNIFPKTRG